jgi:hypothetical protein
MKSLKSALKFWQEIVFVVSIGLLLIEITKWVMLSQTMDGWDIFLVCSMLPLLVCLIGQLFWKNKALAIVLSCLLVLSSVIFILMSLYFIGTTSTKMIQAIAMFILGLFLLFAAVTMSRKFNSNIKTLKTKTPII